MDFRPQPYMATQKKHKALRIILISVGVLLLVLGCVAWYFASNYEKLIKQRLPMWVAKATDSVYNVSVEDISISLISHTVTLKNARFWPDSSEAGKKRIYDAGMGTTFVLNVDEIKADGLLWEQILSQKEINCRSLQILRPKLQVITANVDSLADTAKKVAKQKIEKISFGDIAFIDPDITLINKKDSVVATYTIKGGRTDVHNWVYDPQEPKNKGNLLYSKYITSKIDTVYFKTKDGIYDITAGAVEVSSKDRTANAKNFRVHTLLSKDEFHKLIGHQKDIYSVHFPTIAISGLDMNRILDNGAIVMDEVKLDRSSVEIYHSRMPPPDPTSKMGNYPNQLIQKLAFPLYLKKVAISNGHFKYTEISNVTTLPGSFHIEQMNGTVTNATNIPEHLKESVSCIADLKGKFMNKSDMAAVFNFSLTDKAGGFDVRGTHSNLDAAQLNEIAKALGNISIGSVRISKINFHINGNENEGRAEITMLYKGLKVTILNAKGGDTTNRKNTISLLADALLIHDANPMPDKAVRVGVSYQKRNPYASFFNLIWKCVFEAAIKTSLKSDNVADAIAEQKATGPEKKKTLLQRIFGKKPKKEEQAREKEKKINEEKKEIKKEEKKADKK
ncbi:MAG: hypothetical protein EOP51_23360 [Sphingobacteriales bacterium]|nr:MAG: hypothetical protein EOP51_23360 [Sphingobacteriales bacterium]